MGGGGILALIMGDIAAETKFGVSQLVHVRFNGHHCVKYMANQAKVLLDQILADAETDRIQGSRADPVGKDL